MEQKGEDKVLLLNNSELQPYKNLAVEELLLQSPSPYKHALYLWQNDNTVVVGLNQNTFSEVSPEFNGYVARRLSGGGAVFHDKGNLNFTFVSQKKFYSVDNNNRIILNALRTLGFDAQLSGRNDVTIDGRKISGQAFCLRSEACFHHGTILISSDVEKMRNALSPSSLKLKSKGVASVSSRVGNLTDWKPGISVDEVRNAVAEAFKEFYADAEVDERNADLTDPRIVEIARKRSSEEWLYGRNPKSQCQIEHKFDWGLVSVSFETKGDVISAFDIWTDSMDTALPESLRSKIVGRRISELNGLSLDPDERDIVNLIFK